MILSGCTYLLDLEPGMLCRNPQPVLATLSVKRYAAVPHASLQIARIIGPLNLQLTDFCSKSCLIVGIFNVGIEA
jgi:hypothetical protein